VSGEYPPGDNFITVVKKKTLTPSPVNTAAVANATKRPKVAMIGVRNCSSLSVVQKRVRRKSLFVSRFSPDVTASHVERSLKDQLQLASLACTTLKTKHNSYASVHIYVPDDFHLINNTGVWPNGCSIAPYYGRLSPDQIYTTEASVMSRSPSTCSLRLPTPPPGPCRRFCKRGRQRRCPGGVCLCIRHGPASNTRQRYTKTVQERSKRTPQGSQRSSDSHTSRKGVGDIHSPRQSDRQQGRRLRSSSRASHSSVASSQGTRKSKASRRIHSPSPSIYQGSESTIRLVQIHEEICPNYRDGCVLGFRCQRIHDYPNTTLPALARHVDLLTGSMNECMLGQHFLT
jgi:hypothetical protein